MFTSPLTLNKLAEMYINKKGRGGGYLVGMNKPGAVYPAQYKFSHPRPAPPLSQGTPVGPCFRTGTLSPARRARAGPGSSGSGRGARCSPASAPRCPRPAGSSQLWPRPTGGCSGSWRSSLRSSGPGSSSCFGPSGGPRSGASP